MKTTELTKWMMVCALGVFSMTSCSDDDDSNVNVPENVTRAFNDKYAGVGRVEWDRERGGYLVAEFKNANGIDLSADKMAMQRIKEAAEKAKKELSSSTTTNINLPYITADATGPKHLDVTLTRAKFDELTHDLVNATIVPVQNALKDADLDASEIDKVLLVGGSTRIPAG